MEKEFTEYQKKFKEFVRSGFNKQRFTIMHQAYIGREPTGLELSHYEYYRKTGNDKYIKFEDVATINQKVEEEPPKAEIKIEEKSQVLKDLDLNKKNPAFELYDLLDRYMDTIKAFENSKNKSILNDPE